MKPCWEKFEDVLCVSCGQEYTVTYTTLFNKWTRKVRYCPYCGKALSTEATAESIYQPSEEKKS